MRSLLSDIESDVRELKCLLSSWPESPDPELHEVVLGVIGRAQSRLDQLAAALPVAEAAPVPEVVLEQESVSVQESVPEQETVPVHEAAPAVVRQADDRSLSVAEPAGAMPVSVVWADCAGVSETLRGMFSLNDTFRFSRVLFGGDSTAFFAMLDRLSDARSADEAEEWLRAAISCSEDDAPVADELTGVLKRYFNNRKTD